MKPWWQVATPHRDIREARLDEAVFAADLGDVAQGRGPIDYRDPETFFRKTYVTKGLENLIARLFPLYSATLIVILPRLKKEKFIFMT